MMRAALAVGFAVACLPLGSARAQNSFNDAPNATPPPSREAPNAVPPSSRDARSPVPQPPRDAPRPQAPADASTAGERQDFGVAPKGELHAGAMHGPTPASIPGGQVITTQALVELRGNAKTPALIFDVLGGPERLPGALNAVPAHQAGSFNDATQREFGQFLQQVTQGRRDTPLVFYCQSVQCWMSYNAGLRAIRMGYTQVLWYRGGIEAWKRAGQPVQSAQTPTAAR